MPTKQQKITNKVAQSPEIRFKTTKIKFLLTASPPIPTSPKHQGIRKRDPHKRERERQREKEREREKLRSILQTGLERERELYRPF